MPYPKALLVTYDAGPSAAMKPVLTLRPDWSGFILDAGKTAPPTQDELLPAVAGADIVVVGMSSQKTAGLEFAACTLALGTKKPIVLFEDTWGCHAREWFNPLRHAAAGILVPTDSEIDAAQASFPNAKVIVTGNPAWEPFFFQKGNRQQARILMGAGEEDKVIFISGTKDHAVNAELLAFTLHACALALDPQLMLVFSQHPGDEIDTGDYRGLASTYPNVRCQILDKSVPGKDLVFGADATITYNAASLAVSAVARRAPLICVSPPLAKARLVSESGSAINPLVAAKAAYDGGDNPSKLATVLMCLELGKVYAPQLKTAQEAFLPMPKLCEYEERFIAAIERLAA